MEYKNCEHILLWDSHPDSPSPTDTFFDNLGVKTVSWSGNIFWKFFALRRVCKRFNPDLVHLHSSKAGLVGRLVPLRNKIAYSPHCFAYNRKDLAKINVLFIYIIEKLLSVRTDYFVAHWPVEVEDMRKLNSKKQIMFAPLIDMDFTNYEYRETFCEQFQIKGIGRVRPQKDPILFRKIAQQFGEGSNYHFEWIGSYSDSEIGVFDNTVVKVTDWCEDPYYNSSEEITQILLITSAWESGPLIFYEALRLGIPSILRDIEAFNWLNCVKFKSEIEAFQLLLKITKNADALESLYHQELNQTKLFFTHLQSTLKRYPELN